MVALPDARLLNEDGAESGKRNECEYIFASIAAVKTNSRSTASAQSTPAAPSKKKGDLIRVLSPDEPPPEASFSRQLKLVEIYLQQDRHIGSSLGEGNYLVSAKWWNRWVDTCRISTLSSAGAQPRYAMYPVDNSDLLIIDPSTKWPCLRTGLGVGALHPDVHSASSGSFVYVPRTVWENCFERWYVQHATCSNVRYTNLSSTKVWRRGLCIDPIHDPQWTHDH